MSFTPFRSRFLLQNQRNQVLADFKSGKARLLVATDVAARGLDVKDVAVVINYTFPLTIEEYVHRIGRTGRAGATGISHTFFTDAAKSLAGALGNILREAKAEVPEALLAFGQHTKRKVGREKMSVTGELVFFLMPFSPPLFPIGPPHLRLALQRRRGPGERQTHQKNL